MPGLSAHIEKIKWLVIVAALSPLIALAIDAQQGHLGVDPAFVITRQTGIWALHFLLLTLAITPLRRMSGAHWLLRLRRPLGLMVFFYGAVHLGGYAASVDWPDPHVFVMLLAEQPAIAVGLIAFFLLIPLALTANNAAVRLLGGKRWQTLHRTVYAIAILAVIHDLWLTQQSTESSARPWVHAGLVVALLGWRAWDRIERYRATTRLTPGGNQQIIRVHRRKPDANDRKPEER